MNKEITLTDLLDPEKFDLYKDELLAYFEKGGTWQDLLGYDDSLMDHNYAKAYNLLDSGDHIQAAQAFSFLTMVNPYNYDYWMGLGVAKQELKSFEEAIVSFTTAEAIAPENPIPHIQLAQCFAALEAKEEALNQLNQALDLSKKNPELKKFESLAKDLLQELQKK